MKVTKLTSHSKLTEDYIRFQGVIVSLDSFPLATKYPPFFSPFYKHFHGKLDLNAQAQEKVKPRTLLMHLRELLVIQVKNMIVEFVLGEI